MFPPASFIASMNTWWSYSKFSPFLVPLSFVMTVVSVMPLIRSMWYPGYG